MEKILTGGKEDLAYLTNYWQHAVGSCLCKEGAFHTIVQIDKKYQEQIHLRSDDERIHFIQDFDWAPTADDLDRVLRNLGIGVHNDCLQYRKSFAPKPQTLNDYATAVRGFRLISLAHNDDLLKKNT